jgi:hypothetical protein
MSRGLFKSVVGQYRVRSMKLERSGGLTRNIPPLSRSAQLLRVMKCDSAEMRVARVDLRVSEVERGEQLDFVRGRISDKFRSVIKQRAGSRASRNSSDFGTERE